MTIFFAWAQKGEIFNPLEHCRHDLKIVSFDLSHKEGELALLKVTVVGFDAPHTTECFVSYQSSTGGESVLLFRGQLCHFPIKGADHLWQLEFRACLIEMPKLPSASQAAYDFMELCSFDDTLKGRLTACLQHQTALYEFDRITGQATVCDIFDGEGVPWRPCSVFKKSVSVKFTELPYEGVNLSIKADWVQKDSGEVDVWPALAQAFEEKSVNTLTPKAFQKSFPKVGYTLSQRTGKSGCRVVESDLKPVQPPHTGLLNVYPVVTPLLWQKDVGDDVPSQVHFQRIWFEGVLRVEWQYKQRRREMITCTVRNRVQSPHFRPMKHLTLTLKDVPDSKDARFFTTPRGINALTFAMNYAHCFLAASARCLEIEFNIPFREGMNLSTTTCVDLSSVLDAPGSLVYGKISSYRLYQKGGEGYAFVRCALAIGLDDLPFSQSEPYVECSGVEDSYVSAQDRYQGIFDDIVRKLKPRGILDTKPLHTTTLVESVAVLHSGRDQVKLLLDKQYPQIGSLKDFLKHVPTQVTMILRDLRNEPLLEEKIQLKDQVYTPKRMVQLKEIFYAR